MISVELVDHDLFLPEVLRPALHNCPGMISVRLVDHDLFLPKVLRPALHSGQV